MSIIIRMYKPEYHDKIIKIITTIQQQEFNLPITVADQPDLASIDDSYDAFLVALYEEIPVGTIGYKRIDDYAMIRKMFVKDTFRGKIYCTAQKLLEEIEHKIAASGINRVYLGTTKFFKAAHRFYEKNHYAEIPKTSLPLSFPIMIVDTKFYFKELEHVKPIMIDLPERIETPRLKLQMPKSGFGDNLHQTISDGYEDYVKWLNWHPNIPTTEILEEECRRHHADFILREFIRYLIIEKETDAIVGRCAFPSFQANWMIPQFGISYFICKSKRSNGYATEAAHAMAVLAFKALSARKLEIYCDAENVASTKVPLKLGFKLEYAQKGGWPRYDGKLAELRTYSMFHEADLPKMDVIW